MITGEEGSGAGRGGLDSAAWARLLRQGGALDGRRKIARRGRDRGRGVSQAGGAEERAERRCAPAKGPKPRGSQVESDSEAGDNVSSRLESRLRARARPILRLPARPLWCTARCLHRTPLGGRIRPDIPAAAPSAGSPRALRRRGQKGDFRPDSSSPTGRTGGRSRYARVDRRLLSTCVSPAQRAVHHSQQTKRRPKALTHSASPASQDTSRVSHTW